MKREALIDLTLLLIAFWGSWYFKDLLPIQFRGPSVLIATSIVALIIMKIRGLSFRDIGFIPRALNRKFYTEAMRISFMIFIIQFLGILIIGSLLGNPDPGSAITQQPKTIAGFLVDIFIVTWVVIALGEEFVFRGIILNRVKGLFKDIDSIQEVSMVSGIQAIWFGAAHPSQGLTGMLITGLIGFALGIYLLKNPKQGLWPLIVAHAFIDTVVLTFNFMSQG